MKGMLFSTPTSTSTMGRRLTSIALFSGTALLFLWFFMNASQTAAPQKAVPSFIQISEGLSKQILKAGDGLHFPKKGDVVQMHYTGTLDDGSKFDSSRDRNEPFVTKIGVGQVIVGWDEGVPTMSLGEKAVLKIDAEKGYGERGYPPIIPRNSRLTFEVELLKIN
ncbi:hypothetical protein BCR33DRAFT_680724 [Rhizoclosmatium globosum]|uniref:peptidylprolyl isomerase n=1 Tax=Rhizoclosmatium globosum TaxID=329046 RepID=A0A1Y2C4J1_9FUNG|nr:FK506 binding protein proline rotamase rapamycin-binding protein [Rhizoclosmatium sp. JEL0117]ORY41931.1 hypothetical protein BCR33DRAFT_680724 [Rhizoclosmatium globosum]|eukprot:ORY41931.1 hypothetical protein BCR33DRAFT_680724 [Rhizoclosmatium globosum]